MAQNAREEVRATFHFDDVISFCNAVKLSLPDAGLFQRRPDQASVRACYVSGVNPLADSRWRVPASVRDSHNRRRILRARLSPLPISREPREGDSCQQPGEAHHE
jgi:hypothetical protein